MVALVFSLMAFILMIGIICWCFGQGKQQLDKDIDVQRFSGEQRKPEIHVRFVSKGINPQQIRQSLVEIQETIAPVDVKNAANWYVEVVTDNYMDLGPNNSEVNQIIVPSDYVTPKRTLFKARALHQAAVTTETDLEAWIMHMDEESYFDSANAKKIIEFCENENFLIKCKGQAPSFANGAITQCKGELDNFFISLMDVVRMGEDLFKQQWSFTLTNRCQLGIKGSHWMIHSAIERDKGFDIGLNRSVGEDWACSLTQNNVGQPIKWMHSTIQEQSPFNFTDFIKQRNRWQKAIFLNAINSPELSWKLKFFVVYNTFCFLGAPLGIISTALFQINMGFSVSTGAPLIPMIGDSWFQNQQKLTSFIFYLNQNIGYQYSGLHKYGMLQFVGGALFFLTFTGVWVSAMVESITLSQFLFFVDKFKLEFKVVNKDRVEIPLAKDEYKVRLINDL